MTSRAISYKIAVGGDGATRQAEITFDDLKKMPLALTALAPFAATPMPELDSFILSLGSLIFINDLVTAVLLFAQYSINAILLEGGKGPARVKTTMLLRHGGAPSVAVEQRRRCHALAARPIGSSQ
jgi:hypothetical protein